MSRALLFGLVVVLSSPAMAQTPMKVPGVCTPEIKASEVGLEQLIESVKGPAKLLMPDESIEAGQARRARMRIALDYLDTVAKVRPELVTACGGIAATNVDASIRPYMAGVVIPKDADPVPALSIGRLLVDAKNPSPTGTKQKVPFLISYRDDRIAKESGLSILGDIEYSLGKSLPWHHTLKASFDSNTADDASKSSIDLGYAASHVWVNDRESWLTDLETNFGFDWNTDRKFDREAYSAFVKFVPSSEKLGAGYLNGNDLVIGWQPEITVSVGNIIDAAGNEALQERKQDGGFTRVEPGLSFSFQPKAFPKLGFGLSYLHTFDVSHGWDRGLLEVNATYQVSELSFLTLIHRKGSKKVTFEELDETLFGIGLAY